MRNATLTDYSSRIARAVALIEQTPPGDEPPSLARLAEVAALSPFHFHRVFRLMTGETVRAACQRLRLARSLDALADCGISVTSAAAGSGYATSQGFARAMQRAVGASPSAFRSDPAQAARIEQALRGAPASPGDDGAPLAIEVVSLDPFRVVALRREGSYEALDEGYDALFATVFAAINPPELKGIWGVPLDDPASLPAERLRFDCALDLGGTTVEAPALANLTLEAGTALRLDHCGSYDEVPALFDRLYAALLDTGLALTDHPPLILYRDEPGQVAEGDLRSSLFLPVILG